MKNTALLNLSVGFIKVFILTVITMYIVSILLNTLGKDNYGVVALFASLNQYIGLFLIAISGTIFRFVSLEYNKDSGIANVNKYYSTSFFGLITLSIFVFAVLYFLTPFLNEFINSQQNNFLEIKIFFLLSIVSFFISNLTSVFLVPAIIKHKFYLNDIANIVAKVVQLLVVLFLLFYLFNLSLYTYGLSLVIYSVVYLGVSIYISRKIMPELKISSKYFSLTYLKNMLKMGINVLLNNLGILLYTNSDLIIINIFLTTAVVAEYSIGLQLAFFIAMVGSLFSRLFNPMLSHLIAKKSKNYIVNQILTNSKIFVIFIGLFFMLLIVFSKQILLLWLGEEYVYLYLIVILLSIYQLLHQSTVLFFMYFTLVNKLKIPLMVTIISGILNIILSILFVKYTDYGIFGVIIATILTVFFKTVIFNTWYTAHLLKIQNFKIVKTFLPAFIYICLCTTILFVFVNNMDLNNIYLSIVNIILFAIIYLLFAYFIIFTVKEKIQVLHMIKLYSIIKSQR